ncbi:hypothetical protein J2793_001583 [Paraburkholderia caledonica]|uniref:Uncharacterized protein n=1 Tax=Paraburkholderia caledonica TaxID=134536 RepID=A0AB73I803_9BURK|nr:hypothetical protein [Paraburkholderia caledonica]
MAEHRAEVWADVAANVCPGWDNDHAQLSFFIGYEDRATELSDAGEAGYEALAEAETVADAEGWILQCGLWAAKGQRNGEGAACSACGLGGCGTVAGDGPCGRAQRRYAGLRRR